MFKSYYCKKLEKEINFIPDSLTFCCTHASYGEGIKIEDFGIEKIKGTQKKLINELRNGKIPENCKNCIDLKQYNIKEQLKSYFQPLEPFQNVIINHFKQCDCRCVYCSQREFKYQKPKYEVIPLIKDLFKENLLDKNNLRIEIQGGNVSCLDEFEQIANIFVENSHCHFVIYTNGIKYLPIFEKLPCHFIISLDAGTKETFAKIKQVDAFEQTIENIKRIRANSDAIIRLKYIIVKDINDNEQELNNFLNIVSEIGGISSIVLDIDYNDSFNNFTVPNHYYDLFNIAEKYCETNNIQFEICDYTKKLLAEGSHKK